MACSPQSAPHTSHRALSTPITISLLQLALPAHSTLHITHPNPRARRAQLGHTHPLPPSSTPPAHLYHAPNSGTAERLRIAKTCTRLTSVLWRFSIVCTSLIDLGGVPTGDAPSSRAQSEDGSVIRSTRLGGPPAQGRAGGRLGAANRVAAPPSSAQTAAQLAAPRPLEREANRMWRRQAKNSLPTLGAAPAARRRGGRHMESPEASRTSASSRRLAPKRRRAPRAATSRRREHARA